MAEIFDSFTSDEFGEVNYRLCMSCLCAGRALKELTNPTLTQCYTEMLRDVMPTEVPDQLPPVCWECEALFKKFATFTKKVREAHKILQASKVDFKQFLLGDARQPGLRVGVIDHIDIPPSCEQINKCIEHSVAKEDLKINDKDNIFFRESCSIRIGENSVTDLLAAVKEEVNEDLFLEEHCSDHVEVPKSCEQITNYSGHAIIDVPVIKKEFEKETKDDQLFTNLVATVKEEIEIKVDLQECYSDQVEIPESCVEMTKYSGHAIIDVPVIKKELEIESKEDLFLKEKNSEDGTSFMSEELKDKVNSFTIKNTNTADLQKRKQQNNKYQRNTSQVNTSEVSVCYSPLQCVHCNKEFSSKITLLQHLSSHTGVTKDRKDLKLHKRQRSKEKPHQCEICHMSFTQRCHLRCHMRIHTGEKPFQCEICPMKFAQNTNLRRHMLQHTGEKPYSCNICDKKFARNSTLDIHLRHHAGEKPYQCEICDTKFVKPYNLKVHMRQHTGETPYQCEVCNQKFRHSTNLKRHMMRAHKGEK